MKRALIKIAAIVGTPVVAWYAYAIPAEHGFCFAQMRTPPYEEIFESLYDASKDEAGYSERYEDFQAFASANPPCCVIHHWSDQAPPLNVSRKYYVGFVEWGGPAPAETETGERKFRTVKGLLSNCGSVVDYHTQENSIRGTPDGMVVRLKEGERRR